MSKICMVESLIRHIGQTVTIFTTSGGLSGDGFTGVLAHVGENCVKIICAIGAAPFCCVGSSCLNLAFGKTAESPFKLSWQAINTSKTPHFFKSEHIEV